MVRLDLQLAVVTIVQVLLTVSARDYCDEADKCIEGSTRMATYIVSTVGNGWIMNMRFCYTDVLNTTNPVSSSYNLCRVKFNEKCTDANLKQNNEAHIIAVKTRMAEMLHEKCKDLDKCKEASYCIGIMRRNVVAKLAIFDRLPDQAYGLCFYNSASDPRNPVTSAYGLCSDVNDKCTDESIKATNLATIKSKQKRIVELLVWKCHGIGGMPLTQNHCETAMSCLETADETAATMMNTMNAEDLTLCNQNAASGNPMADVVAKCMVSNDKCEDVNKQDSNMALMDTKVQELGAVLVQKCLDLMTGEDYCAQASSCIDNATMVGTLRRNAFSRALAEKYGLCSSTAGTGNPSGQLQACERINDQCTLGNTKDDNRNRIHEEMSLNNFTLNHYCSLMVTMEAGGDTCMESTYCIGNTSTIVSGFIRGSHQDQIRLCDFVSDTDLNNTVTGAFKLCMTANELCDDESMQLGNTERMHRLMMSNMHVLLKTCFDMYADQYQGCYKARSGDFTRGATMSNADMNVDMCVTWCRNSGRSFAALKNGTECLCDHGVDTRYLKSSLDCYDMQAKRCPGNKNYICGSRDALSIYRVCPLDKKGSRCTTECTSCGTRGCSSSGVGCLGSCETGYTNLIPGDCATACPKGAFGPFCRYSCVGRCADDDCDPRDGLCNAGCAGNNRDGAYCLQMSQIVPSQDACLTLEHCTRGASDTLANDIPASGMSGLMQSGLCSGDSIGVIRNKVKEVFSHCLHNVSRCHNIAIHNRLNAAIDEFRLLVVDICMNKYRSQYEGCYDVSSGNPLSRNPLSIVSTTNASMTVEFCLQHCRTEYNNYGFAGIKNGTHCFCGTAIGHRVVPSSLECYGSNAVDCPGDNTVKCGARNAMLIYTVCPLDKKGRNCSEQCHHCGHKGCNPDGYGARYCSRTCQSGYYDKSLNGWAAVCNEPCRLSGYGPSCMYSCYKRCANGRCDPFGRCLNGCMETSMIGPYCRSSNNDGGGGGGVRGGRSGRGIGGGGDRMLSDMSSGATCKSKVINCKADINKALQNAGKTFTLEDSVYHQDEYCTMLEENNGMIENVMKMRQCVKNEVDACVNSEKTEIVKGMVHMMRSFHVLCSTYCSEVETKMKRSMECFPDELYDVDQTTMDTPTLCKAWKNHGTLVMCLEKQSSCCPFAIHDIKLGYADAVDALSSDIAHYCPDVKTAIDSLCVGHVFADWPLKKSGSGKVAVFYCVLLVMLAAHRFI